MSARKITDRHARAAELLVAGSTATEVANELEVSRETVSRWKSDPEFIARLNELRNEATNVAREKLRGLVARSVQVIEEVLADPDSPPKVRLDAAFRVLDRCGLDRVGAGEGSEDPEEIEKNRKLGELLSASLW